MEELCLENNRITSLYGLLAISLKHLKKLDVSHNELNSLSGIDALQDLVQLSVESNLISSLVGLHQLGSLMELYMGNNNIAKISEIDNLRMLPKLIIVDLAGNPVCNDSCYRLYALYCVRRLKVLDGASITAEESAAAKEKYSGRLTLEKVRQVARTSYATNIQLSLGMLSDQTDCHISGKATSLDVSDIESDQSVNIATMYRHNTRMYYQTQNYEVRSHSHSAPRQVLNEKNILSLQSPYSKKNDNLEMNVLSPRLASPRKNQDAATFLMGPVHHIKLANMVVLNLSNQKLKDASVLNGAGLLNFQDLNLDHNSLTSFEDLVALPALIVLRLNHNKVSCCGSWADSKEKFCTVEVRVQHSCGWESNKILTFDELVSVKNLISNMIVF